MKAFQKQAEAHLAHIAATGLVVRTLPKIIAPGVCISTMALSPSTPRPAILLFVVFGLLTRDT